jgi:hypothetical protein
VRPVTEREPGVLIIVFGARGRVGRELMPMLADGVPTVIGVVRDRKPDLRRSDLHWMQVDVTERDVWQRSILALSGIASIYPRTVIVDLVLDRRTVSTMRRSIADTTSYVRRLTTSVINRGSTPLLLAASTTAVLATRLYQTPYGSAKRRQAETYATLPNPHIVLLPTLSADSGGGRPEWTYHRAAATVGAVVRQVTPAANGQGTLWLPEVPAAPAVSTPWPNRLAEAAAAHLQCVVSHRDEPQAHRRAARSRLDLTPESLRTRLDHHTAPDGLALSFAHRAGLLIQRTPTGDELHEGLCTP